MSKYDDLAKVSDKPRAESADLWLTLMDLPKPPLLPPYRLSKNMFLFVTEYYGFMRKMRMFMHLYGI